MSFRAIYIIKPTSNFPECILFHRTFPIIERKCKKESKDYVAIPLNFPTLIIDELELKRKSNEFNIKLDSCSSTKTSPIYHLLNQTLHPVVAFYKNGLIYSCIPYNDDDETIKNKLNLEENLLSPAVALAYTLLENISNFIGFGNTYETLQIKLQSLHKFASIGFPFGIPTELNIETALGIASYADGIQVPKIKGPAWRPTSFKGKQLLQLEINEFVKAIQFDSKETADVCEIFGSINCKIDVEESPEISLDITAPLDSTVHNQMLYHPCVQLVDDVTPIMKSDNIGQHGSRKLRFCPPTNDFALCHYKVKLLENDLPVKAYYQMKGDENKVSIMVQLQLSDSMKNTFEAFEVKIPFFNRGAIVDYKCLTSSNLTLLPDKCSLLWDVGQKFSSKGADKILEANVTFDRSLPIKTDPLLSGVNSFILMSWKVNEFTYSGLKFENKSVEMFPSSKIKVNSVTTLKTVEYKVWNSRGDVTNTAFDFGTVP